MLVGEHEVPARGRWRWPSVSSSMLRKLSLPAKVSKAIEDFVAKVAELYPDARIYLFGSYARGTWLEDSDVDIVVVSGAFEGIPFWERGARLRRLASLEVPFQIFAYTPEELEEALRRSVAIQDASEYWVRLR